MNINDLRKTFVPSCSRLCPMMGRPMVTMDMEPEIADRVDVLFLGVNPGAKEAELGRPFIGPAGQLLRRVMRTELPGRVCAFSNVILCSTPNESGIADPTAAMECCLANVRAICARLMPKVYVPCGAKAITRFKIEDRITYANGRTYHVNGCDVVPMIHPSAVLRGNCGEDDLAKAMRTVRTLLEKQGA